MRPELGTVARGPRALLALLLTVGAGAFGGAALATASAAGAAQPPAGTSQGLTGAPVVQINGIDPDGTVHVTITPSPDGPLSSLDPNSYAAKITWSPSGFPPGAPQPNPMSAPLDRGSCTGSPSSSVTCTFTFPKALLVSGFLLNGFYTIEASARDCVVGLGCTPGNAVPQRLGIANPPATPPANVTAVPGAAPGSVKISWKATSPEPDTTGYQVLRADNLNSVACQVTFVLAQTEYSCTDTPTKDGSYAYHVVAHRWGPGYSTAVTDQPGTASATTKAVAVVGTSANTTTTAPGGTGTLGPPGFTGKVSQGKALAPGNGSSGLKIAPASPAVVSPETPVTADPGFSPSLNYGARPPRDPGTTVASSPLAAPVAPHKGKTSVGTIAVVGAGLLIGVVALHGLWLRSEVRRSPVLEVLEPET